MKIETHYVDINLKNIINDECKNGNGKKEIQ